MTAARTLLIVALFLTVGVVLWAVNKPSDNPEQEISAPASPAPVAAEAQAPVATIITPAETSSGEAAIGGNFTLTDQSGKEVKESDFRGNLHGATQFVSTAAGNSRRVGAGHSRGSNGGS